MSQRLLFFLLGVAVLVLAVGGWIVEGVRWTVTGSRHRPELAAA